jgi:hypothetical protein
MSAQGVFTPEYRAQFVTGWLTGGVDPMDGSVECGDGTEFPLLVTRDQLAEILYRVRDAWFTAGELTYTLAGFPISISTADPPTVGSVRVVSELVMGDETVNARGYFAEDTAVAALWSGYFKAVYTPAFLVPDIRDVDDNERAIWIPSSELTWGSPSFPYTAGSSITWGTAFAHYLYSFGDTSSSTEYRIVSPGSAVNPSLYLSTPLQVAWFGGVSPFDPASSLYLEMNFSLYAASDLMVSSLYTAYPSGNLVIELSTDTVQFPLYLSPLANTLSAAVAYDFTITAQEWWPYAKGDPDTPVWNSLTGAKL